MTLFPWSKMNKKQGWLERITVLLCPGTYMARFNILLGCMLWSSDLWESSLAHTWRERKTWLKTSWSPQGLWNYLREIQIHFHNGTRSYKVQLYPKTIIIIRFHALQHQLVTGKCKRIFPPRFVTQLPSLGLFYLPPKHWRQEFDVLSWTPRISLVTWWYALLTDPRLFWSPDFREGC